MSDAPQPFRLEITALWNDSKSYIYRDKKGNVHYVAGDETPLALSNLVGGHAASLRFNLEDCEAKEAINIVSKVFHTIQHTRGLKQPFARADWFR